MMTVPLHSKTAKAPWCYDNADFVAAFQEFMGLPVDGMAGPVTNAAFEKLKRDHDVITDVYADHQTLSSLKINDWIEAEVAKAEWPSADSSKCYVTSEQTGEIARGAALQVIMDKAAFLDNLVVHIHSINESAGWWTDLNTGEDLHGKRNVGELLALKHSEISEALDAADETILPILFALQAAVMQAIANEADRKQALLDVHAHLSRALEHWRKGGKPDDKLPHRPGFRVELIDAMIRIFDTLGSDKQGQREHPAGTIFLEKIRYNMKRADHKPENRRQADGKKF